MKRYAVKGRIVSAVVALVLILSIVPVSVHAVTEEQEELEKMYSAATLEDEFTDNVVAVVVMPEYNETVYTADSFTGINCVNVREICSSAEPDGLGRILKLTLAEHSKQNVLDAIAVLEQRSDIYYADADFIIETAAVITDPAYQNGYQWGMEKIDLASAWDISTGSTSITVGVIDSGIDASHPDMGNVDPVLSKSFIDSAPLVDGNGHGTMVASIIGAASNNGIGMTGVCPNVKLVSLKVTNAYGMGAITDVAEAVNYARLKGIDVLNYSNGTMSADYTGTLLVALRNYSGIFVCSAGNMGLNVDQQPHYPSQFSYLPNVISVGASTAADTKWEGSNYGAVSVDIFAPGENIYCCRPGNSYAYASGTSLAAPFVTGVVVLMRAEYPEFTASEIKEWIINYAEPVYDSNHNNVFGNLCYSGGRLNAYYALLG